MAADVTRVLFVCLGNICRSPLAEGIARVLASERGLQLTIDSAGTGAWHVGNPPDRRMQLVAKAYGFPIDDLRARAVDPARDRNFDLLVAMDGNNAANLVDLFGGRAPRTVRLLEYHPGPEIDVPDPYYGGDEGFEHVYQLVRSGIEGLLDSLTAGRD